MPPQKKNSSRQQTHRVRIIGGEWRGRKLDIVDVPELRPTPDRVRETLFNWLQLHIIGKHCLDLFSGTGALGFEALSRGATSATFVDENPAVIKQLQQNKNILQAGNADIIKANVTQWLEKNQTTFDVVFMDPPYRKNLVIPVCNMLEQNGWLSDEAWIFIEQEKEAPVPQLPGNWTIQKETGAGQVSCYLAWRKSAG